MAKEIVKAKTVVRIALDEASNAEAAMAKTVKAGNLTGKANLETERAISIFSGIENDRKPMLSCILFCDNFHRGESPG